METIYHYTGTDEDGKRTKVAIQVMRVISPREDRWHAWGPDGRKYRVIWVKSPSSRSVVKVARPYWEVMYEIRQYSPISGEDGKRDIPAIIRGFISSQFQDGEEMTKEIVGDLLSHAEHRNKNGHLVEFLPVYATKIEGHFKEKGEYYPLIYKMIEDALIGLFCECEKESRFLVEDNGVFHWQTR